MHDNSFLENIAKSETYKIVRYEEQLRQRGKLRYQDEIEQFWQVARDDPVQLQHILKRENIGEQLVPDNLVVAVNMTDKVRLTTACYREQIRPLLVVVQHVQ